MTTDKIRVYDIAKELNLSNKEIIELLKTKLNIEVKSHSSSVLISQFQELKEALKPKKNLLKEVPPKQPVKKEEPKQAVEKKQEPPVQKEDKGKFYSSTRKTFPKNQDKGGEKTHTNNEKPQFNRDGQRFQGQRPPFNKDRGERFERGERPQFSRDGQRFQGQRPPFNKERGEGQFNRDGQRFQGQKLSFNRERGDRNFNRDGQKPQNNSDRQGMPSKQPIKRQFIAQPPVGMNVSRKQNNNAYKKKDSRQFGQSKEEREEQARLMQPHHKNKKKPQVEVQVEKASEIIIEKPLTVAELSEKMNVSVAEIVKNLMMQGILATVNQPIDVDTATKLAESMDILVLDSSYVEKENTDSGKQVINLNSKHLKPRPPVVTIMGHVDHGKTTLLDAIRASKHKIVSGEVGGITQSIGAYTAYVNDRKIVFIDTPGHEAFTAMRARGAQVTDIVILVVAADDGIMPQTIEAINHAKAADIPIIVAVNKIDKEGADPDRVLSQLTEYGLVPEEWGGQTVCCKVSAIQGKGLDELLEYVLLIADMQELKADSTVSATGVVIEAKLDKGRGPVATLLIQNGTLRKGNCIVVGSVGGKIRALLSDEGVQIDKAGPSTPVEIFGLSEVPQAGDRFEILNNEKEMKSIVAKRKSEERESKLDAISPAKVKKDLIKAQQDETHELNIIIKANTHGSAEAVSASIQQLESKQIFTKVIHAAVGDITEADVMLASASNAIIIGFSVKEDANTSKVAQQEGVDIRIYEIIYDILDDIEKTMLGLLQPEVKEVEIGKAEVRQIFTRGKTDKIAGCYVLEGKMVRNKLAVVQRNGVEIFKGNLDMLKRFKDDAKEVNAGYECGISFNKFNDLQENDIIIMYTTQEVERKVLI